LNRTVDLDQVLNTALAQAAGLLYLDTGWIWLLHPEAGETYLAAAQNLPPGLAAHPALMEGSCYCLDTYRAGDLDGAANINVITCSRLKKLVDGTDGLRYHASIPLYAHGKELGVLNVASADWRELTPDDLRLLYTFGDMLAIAIERARLFARSAEFGATEERNRLAREIHDTLAQGLAGIALQLETADALFDTGVETEKTHQVVLQALQLTRANLEEARRSVLDLRAAPLEGRSLPAALAELARATQARASLGLALSISGDERPLPARLEVGLYRIAQEALENVMKHARARHASLKLELRPEQVTLAVSDDGAGFDLQKIPPGRFGLRGMNERARLMGGVLEVQSAPGKGTYVQVIVPLT
jgi:two-component system NarL family sensor kinase